MSTNGNEITSFQFSEPELRAELPTVVRNLPYSFSFYNACPSNSYLKHPRPTRGDVEAVVAEFDKATGFKTPPAAVSEIGSPAPATADRARSRDEATRGPSEPPAVQREGKARDVPKASSEPNAKRRRKQN